MEGDSQARVEGKDVRVSYLYEMLSWARDSEISLESFLIMTKKHLLRHLIN